LGLPLQYVKAVTSLDEFEQWQAYFYRRKTEREKSDWYLASVACAITNAFSKRPTKIEDHLLVFEGSGKKNPDSSKATWLTALGYKEQ
jgi:hypothetical protein